MELKLLIMDREVLITLLPKANLTGLPFIFSPLRTGWTVCLWSPTRVSVFGFFSLFDRLLRHWKFDLTIYLFTSDYCFDFFSFDEWLAGDSADPNGMFSQLSYIDFLYSLLDHIQIRSYKQFPVTKHIHKNQYIYIYKHMKFFLRNWNLCLKVGNSI